MGIKLIPLDRMTESNLEQFWKTPFPIEITLSGMAISSSAEQLKNVDEPIDVKVAGRLIDFSFKQ